MKGMIRHLYRCVFPVIMLMIPAFLCAGCSAAEKTEKKAAEQIGSLEEQRNALQKEVETLKAAARDYRERFQRLIDDQAHILKAENALFE